MYENYFYEYYVSDVELKEKIYQTIEILINISPEEFDNSLLEYANPQNLVEEVLQNLTNLIPAIKNVENGFGIISNDACLRVMAIQLDIILYGKRVEYLLLKLIHMVFSTRTYAVEKIFDKNKE